MPKYNVALHPEGVDRNRPSRHVETIPVRVALHPEGVDRNFPEYDMTAAKKMSPSTRRAWIEIFACKSLNRIQPVALHPEGVDRNFPPKERKR